MLDSVVITSKADMRMTLNASSQSGFKEDLN